MISKDHAIHIAAIASMVNVTPYICRIAKITRLSSDKIAITKKLIIIRPALTRTRVLEMAIVLSVKYFARIRTPTASNIPNSAKLNKARSEWGSLIPIHPTIQLHIVRVSVRQYAMAQRARSLSATNPSSPDSNVAIVPRTPIPTSAR